MERFNRHWFNNEKLNKFEKEREELGDRLQELQENLYYWENSCDYKKELPDSKKIELAEIIIEIRKCKGRLEEIDGYRDSQFNFMDHWVG